VKISPETANMGRVSLTAHRKLPIGWSAAGEFLFYYERNPGTSYSWGMASANHTLARFTFGQTVERGDKYVDLFTAFLREGPPTPVVENPRMRVLNPFLAIARDKVYWGAKAIGTVIFEGDKIKEMWVSQRYERLSPAIRAALPDESFNFKKE
jgi:hypothetical protein